MTHVKTGRLIKMLEIDFISKICLKEFRYPNKPMFTFSPRNLAQHS